MSKTENENIMSVQITGTNQVIRLILAYGSQENASKNENDKFYEDLNIEVERAKLCGEQILIVGDLNAKLGHPIIKNDVYDISMNGQLVKEVIDEHGMSVAKSLNKCTGTWTRTRNFKNKFEKSVIDYVIMSRELEENLINMYIDEEKEFCPYSARKTKKGKKITHSNHNALILNFELIMNRRGEVKQTTKPVLKFTKEGMKKFSSLTENNEVLCNIWQKDLGFQKKYKLWTKEFEKAPYKCFERIHPKKENSGTQ